MRPFQPTLPARGATSEFTLATAGIKFQPTLPARGATRGCAVAIPQAAISTHAPRTGSDVPSLYAPMDT